MMEFGTVKWFNLQKDFGYIAIPGKPDLWFHRGDGRIFAIDRITKKVHFGEFEKRNGIPVRRLRVPLQGEEIAFMVGSNAMGEKASPWGFKSSYDHALETVKTMPEPPTYRVMYSMTTTVDPVERPEIKWEGKDLRELPREFSRPSYGQSPTSDPFVPYNDPDGFFSVRRWFEKEVNGVFVPCGDPRPR